MLEVKEISISSLKEWDDNPRLNDHAVDAVARSISTFGFNVPILCDRELRIIAGHTRLKAAKRIGMKKVPVIILAMTASQRKAFSIADNKTTEIADWDFPQLQSVLEELRSEDIDLTSLGYSANEISALLTPEEDIDWDVFDKSLTTVEDSKYVLVPVRVLPDLKELFREAIKRHAKAQDVSGNDFSVIAGKVLTNLLGLNE